MSSESAENHASGWGGMVLGVLTMLLGLALCVALWTFHIREVGWRLLNPGDSVEGTLNLLGGPGLYAAGISYWLLGGCAWLFAALLIWWGGFRLFHRGILPDLVLYGGLGLLVCACLILTAADIPGSEWVQNHRISCSGGIVGLLLGDHLLIRFLGNLTVLAIASLGYLMALIYASGNYLRAFARAIRREAVDWKVSRGVRKVEREEARRAREAARVRASMESAAMSVRPASAEPASGVRRYRTGDDLESLYEEADEASRRHPLERPVSHKTEMILEDSESEDEPLPAPEEVPVSSPVKQNTPSVLPAEPKRTEDRRPPKQSLGPMPSTTPPTDEFKNYRLPGLELLHHEEKPAGLSEADKEEMEEIQQKIIDTLTTFRVEVTPGDITRGPTITRYEVYPARGVRVNVFDQYAKDIALATKAESVNIVAPIPGKDTVGIEIVNRRKVAVPLRELLEDPAFRSPKKKIPLALGKDVYGNTVIGDLTSMPHLLVAGATGSGKSVCINSMLASMLLRFRPDELRLILVDPKVVEMQPYSKLPHLIVPVVTDPKKVPNALRWCVNEMEHRYHCFAKVNVRNFEAFNKRPLDVPIPSDPESEELDEVDEEAVEAAARELENPGTWSMDEDLDDCFDDEVIPERFPYIVIIIDELADLMQTAGADVESNIARLTQKARAAGIHLIVATQTPRRQVVTGIIKANIPTRIACQVASGMDSRVILDRLGAEKLVGKGDLLYLPPGSSQMERAQGAYISDEEVEVVVAHCAAQAKQHFCEDIRKRMDEPERGGADSPLDDAEEECYAKCLEVAVTERKVSTSLLQRRLSIGYGKAARMMDLMEKRGIIGPADNTNRPRKVLVD